MSANTEFCDHCHKYFGKETVRWRLSFLSVAISAVLKDEDIPSDEVICGMMYLLDDIADIVDPQNLPGKVEAQQCKGERHE